MIGLTGDRRLFLALNVKGAGAHDAAWRHPDTDVRRINDFSALRDLVQRADAAGIDAAFFADTLVHSGSGDTPPVAFAPASLLGALAASTQAIGLVGTFSTTYGDPFTLAREMASLHNISGGRVGWNAVTTGSPRAALNFSQTRHPGHEERYARAEEFVSVVRGLWSGWQEGAIRADPASGQYLDLSRIAPLKHRGHYFNIEGPLPTPAPGNRHPVILQAGGSSEGRAFAARSADVIYFLGRSLSSALTLRAEIDRLAALTGRSPGAVRLISGVRLIIDETEEAARRTERELRTLAGVDYTLRHLENITGVALAGAPLDAPLPELPAVDTSNAIRSQIAILKEIVDEGNVRTVGDLIHHLDGGVGTLSLVGTAASVADLMEEWFAAGAVDGFNIGAYIQQGGTEKLLALLLPELERRGLRTPVRYGATLRERLDL